VNDALIAGSLLAVALAALLAKRNRDPRAVKLRRLLGLLVLLFGATMLITTLARVTPFRAALPGVILWLLIAAFGFVSWFLDRRPA